MRFRNVLILPGLLLVSPFLLAETPWLTPSGPKAVTGVLRYQMVNTGTAWVIQFKNTGTERLHFLFRFPSRQNKEEALLRNGRVHLSPGKTAQVPLPKIQGMDPATLAASPLKVQLARRADGDGGGFETDDD